MDLGPDIIGCARQTTSRYKQLRCTSGPKTSDAGITGFVFKSSVNPYAVPATKLTTSVVGKSHRGYGIVGVSSADTQSGSLLVLSTATYVGCFNEDTAARSHAVNPTGGTTGISIEECAQECGEYSHFSLHENRVCWCGNSATLANGANAQACSCTAQDNNIVTASTDACLYSHIPLKAKHLSSANAAHRISLPANWHPEKLHMFPTSTGGGSVTGILVGSDYTNSHVEVMVVELLPFSDAAQQPKLQISAVSQLDDANAKIKHADQISITAVDNQNAIIAYYDATNSQMAFKTVDATVFVAAQPTMGTPAATLAGATWPFDIFNEDNTNIITVYTRPGASFTHDTVADTFAATNNIVATGTGTDANDYAGRTISAITTAGGLAWDSVSGTVQNFCSVIAPAVTTDIISLSTAAMIGLRNKIISKRFLTIKRGIFIDCSILVFF